MAISVTNWVWSRSMSRHGARLVLLFLADSMRTEDGWAWPSNKEIATKAGISERAVQLAIKDLEKLGELEVEFNGGPRGCNRYHVLMTPAESSGGEESSGAKNSAPTPEESAHETVKNPKESSSSKKNVRREPQREDVDRICSHLVDRIVANGSKRPNITQAWRKEARLLLDADGRTEEQVHTAIDWCQDSPFWVDKIMSMPKLREKYDQLRLQAMRDRDRQNGHANGNGQRTAPPVKQVNYTDEEYTSGWTP